MIYLDGDSLRSTSRRHRARLAPVGSTRGRARAGACGAGRRRRLRPARHANLRHQHRVRQLCRTCGPARLARGAPGQPAAQPRRRRGRSAAGSGGPRDDGAARQRARQGVFRNPARDAGTAAGVARNAACIRWSRRADRSGASGDLAPLAHLALVLIGEGAAWHDGMREPGAAALARAGVEPAVLAPKEGLALINGTQPSTALLGLALAGALRLARAADIAAALSIDALQGSTRPFDPRIHAARGFPGQQHPPPTCSRC